MKRPAGWCGHVGAVQYLGRLGWEGLVSKHVGGKGPGGKDPGLSTRRLVGGHWREGAEMLGGGLCAVDTLDGEGRGKVAGERKDGRCARENGLSYGVERR